MPRVDRTGLALLTKGSTLLLNLPSARNVGMSDLVCCGATHQQEDATVGGSSTVGKAEIVEGFGGNSEGRYHEIALIIDRPWVLADRCAPSLPLSAPHQSASTHQQPP